MLVVTRTVVVVLIVIVLSSVVPSVVVLSVIVPSGSARTIRIPSARRIISAVPPVATTPAIVVPFPGSPAISRPGTSVSSSISRVAPGASVVVTIAFERSLALAVLALLLVRRGNNVTVRVSLRVVVLLLRHLIQRRRLVRLIVLLVLHQLRRVLHVAQIVRRLILFLANVLHESSDMLDCLSLLRLLFLLQSFFFYLLQCTRENRECTRYTCFVTYIRQVMYLKLVQFDGTILSLFPMRRRYAPGPTSRGRVISLEI